MFLLFLPSLDSSRIAQAVETLANPSLAPDAPLVTSTPLALAPLTPDDKKKLPIEFKRAQNDEDRAMEHQEKSSTRELNAAQSAALKSWRYEEKKVRRQYFEQHLSGPERRHYVQGYLERKKAFDQAQKDDLITAKRNWKTKREDLKRSQKESDFQFKAAIQQNLKPEASLWPKGH